MAKNKYTDIDLSKYNNGFQKTDDIIQAEQKKANAENALANLGDFKFNYGNQEAYDKAMNDILNRKDFSYDLNGDMLYQQYKDNYINQGKMAMMDTMGQASAMTGGYGNSYAQTVGQQTYQGYLQGLNNVIPELYQMALDRYNAEGDRLTTNYGLLSTDRQNALSEYTNEYNTNLSRFTSDRDYYTTDYNNIYNRDYTTWNDNRTYDTSQYWNEYNAGYTAEQDAIANQLARDQLAEQIRANKASEALARARSSGGGSSGGSGGSSGTVSSIVKGLKAAGAKGDDALYNYIVNNLDDYDSGVVLAAFDEAGVPRNFVEKIDQKNAAVNSILNGIPYNVFRK